MKEFKGAFAIILSLILVFSMAFGTYAAPEVDQTDPEFLYKLYITDFLQNDIGTTGKTQDELLDIKAAELGISDSRAFELELECGLHPVIYTKDERPLPETTVTTEPTQTADPTEPLCVTIEIAYNMDNYRIELTATATGGTGNYQYKFSGSYSKVAWLEPDSFETEYQSSNRYCDVIYGTEGDSVFACTVTDGVNTAYVEENYYIQVATPVLPEDTKPAETEPSEVITPSEIVTEPDTEVIVDSSLATTDEEKTTYRYYFYKPGFWTANEYSDTVGIYWWEGADACPSWPGYEANKADAEGVYYYDVPADVSCIIFNNFVDGGMDPEAEIYKMAYQTFNIGSEYYEAGECFAYPDGTENFDGMIFVVASDVSSVNAFSSKHTDEGMWYYYYGNGEYGITPEKGEDFYTTSFLREYPASDAFDENIIPVFGDVNNDGKLNIKDATNIQKYVAKIWLFDKVSLYLADINEDGVVNVKDATHIQKKIANII